MTDYQFIVYKKLPNEYFSNRSQLANIGDLVQKETGWNSSVEMNRKDIKNI